VTDRDDIMKTNLRKSGFGDWTRTHPGLAPVLELPNITAELSGLNIIFVCMNKQVVMTRLPISPQQPRCKRSTSMPKLQG